jgi:hypothetical protein
MKDYFRSFPEEMHLHISGAAGTFNIIPITAAVFYFPDVYGAAMGRCLW